jgi:hypothetical protein
MQKLPPYQLFDPARNLACSGNTRQSTPVAVGLYAKLAVSSSPSMNPVLD